MNNPWPYPGSRWWKFDFHTHTPMSRDTEAWQRAVGTCDEVMPEKWLFKYMAEGIDCVAVTDHNSGAWIDQLKSAYATMKSNPPEGFRELHLFPGVELSVNGGFHMLAIFDPSKTTGDIDSLLGAVRFQGTRGDSNDVTGESPINVVQAILDAGGLPIPAHVDSPDKGMLRLDNGSRTKAALDSQTLNQIFEQGGILAMEQVDPTVPLPTIYKQKKLNWTSVIGSDCHSFQGSAVPGSRFTWVKMATPSLEGLRLALIDGQGISIRRSDQSEYFNPFSVPEHTLESITIDKARYMGNGSPQVLNLTPYMNVMVGGRGTGKSTIVHALRLALGRKAELSHFPEMNSPRSEFEAFEKVAQNRRSGTGALRSETEIQIVYLRDGIRNRITWKAEDGSVMLEEAQADCREQFDRSSSQLVSRERFPIRILSQGQVAAMAGENRRALLGIIDDEAGIAAIRQRLEEAVRTFFTQRARLREIDGRLAKKPDVERKMGDLLRKLKALSETSHAEVLKAHQRALRQVREVEMLGVQANSLVDALSRSIHEAALDEWPEGVFNGDTDKDILGVRQEIETAFLALRDEMNASLERFKSRTTRLLDKDERSAAWRARANTAQTKYQKLKAELSEKGIGDPQEFGRLVQESQGIEAEIKRFAALEKDRDVLVATIADQLSCIHQVRTEFTSARQDFVTRNLSESDYVSIEVIPFGYDPKQIETEFRELIDAPDERFSKDILELSANGSSSGLIADLCRGSVTRENLDALRNSLIQPTERLGGHFFNHLEKKRLQPEFADRVACWFPEDDLKISYKREQGGEFVPLSQGSKGQRAAAILAFLLAFGDEPLVLDQPEDDLDNHLIYELIVKQIRENKCRRQLIIATHNPNIVVNGDAEMVYAFSFTNQCYVKDGHSGALQEGSVRKEVCEIMEGGHEAFSRRWNRLGKEI